MLLRRYHDKKEAEVKEVTLEVGEYFIEDIDLAFDLAIEEDKNINGNISTEDKEAPELSEKVVRGSNLSELTVKQLNEVAKDRGIAGYSDMKKDELIEVLAGD